MLIIWSSLSTTAILFVYYQIMNAHIDLNFALATMIRGGQSRVARHFPRSGDSDISRRQTLANYSRFARIFTRFARVFTRFARIFTRFARIFTRFARIFSRFAGVVLLYNQFVTCFLIQTM